MKTDKKWRICIFGVDTIGALIDIARASGEVWVRGVHSTLRISPWIRTTDLRLQADAVSDPLSVRDSLADHFPTGLSCSRCVQSMWVWLEHWSTVTVAAAKHGQSQGRRMTGIKRVRQHYSICSLCSAAELAECRAWFNDPRQSASVDFQASADGAKSLRCVRIRTFNEDRRVALLLLSFTYLLLLRAVCACVV